MAKKEKYGKLVIFIMIIMSIFIIISIEIFVYDQFVYREINNKLLNQINDEQPDIIMIGNSMLSHNVDQELFESELSNLTNRTIKSLFWSSGGMHSAWWYLSMKNQIIKSNVTDIPIGIVYRLDFITRPKWGIAGKYQDRIDQLLTANEDVFYQKTKTNNYYKIKNIYKTYFFRHEFLNLIKKYWVKQTLHYYEKKTNNKIFPDIIFQKKFPLENLKNQNDFLFQGSTESDEDNFKRLNDFESHINSSFLPNMIYLMKNFSFFVVETHMNPNTTNDKYLWDYNKNTHKNMNQYRKKLINYLFDNDINFIDLHNYSNLNYQKLYLDRMHFNKNGSKIFTRKLAQDIYIKEIIK
jgi:hypothetical protein